MGIGLSSSTGFKPFIPLLVIGISSKLGMIELTNHQWLDSFWFIVVIALFALLDVFSTSIPIMGRMFDVLGIPITLICAYIAISALIGTSGDPFVLQSLVSAILGIGLAAIFKTLTIIKNGLSDAVTLGFSSSVNSIIDSLNAVFVSIVAILSPMLATLLLGGLLFVAYKIIIRLKRSRESKLSNVVKSI